MTVEDSEAVSSSESQRWRLEGQKKKKDKCTCKGFPEGSGRKKQKKKKYSGTAWFRERQIWIDFIKKHRRDLRHAEPVVDDKPPKLNVPQIYDPEVFKGLRSALNGAFGLNQLIVKSLHEVNIRPGKTDTFTFKYNKPFHTNYAFRRAEAKNVEKQNLIMADLIKNPNSRMKTAKEYADEWELHESIMESNCQFPLWWKVKSNEEAAIETAPPPPHVKQYVTEKSAKYQDLRPRVVLEVSIQNVGVVGKMVAVLYSDYVPMTVKNFLAFCDSRAQVSYKGNRFYLIFQNYYCQTGDVVENHGFGGTSIYGPYFGNEDTTLKHGERGVLTMYTKIPNRNQSQFLITFRKLESLDGRNVAFGKIVRGLHVLDTIEGLGSKKTGRPKMEIYISDCDEI